MSDLEIGVVPFNQVICSKSSALTETSALGLIARIAFAISIMLIPPLLLLMMEFYNM